LNPSAGIEQANELNVQIAPNPVQDVLKINMQQTPSNMRIVNAVGQEMRGEWSNNPGQSFDISHLQTGMYILELQFSNTTKSIRFVKE
jgi:hypothetical protein